MRAHGRETTKRIGIVFLESIIVTPTLLFANMRAKVRASPDFYRHAGDEAAAMADLRERIRHYESTYQSLSEGEGAYIKVSPTFSARPHDVEPQPPLRRSRAPLSPGSSTT